MGAAVVVNGASLECDKGTGPCSLIVVPPMVEGDSKAVATVMDFTPSNVPSFVMCQGTNSANPQVAALTAAAQGTPTPAPCVPVITGPWSPGDPTVKVGAASFTVLTDDSTCKCAWTGTISVKDAGTTDVTSG